MREEKKVSVIIPVYNGENCIHECLNATLLQTYENIEVIVINDGSTDRSFDICQKYAMKDQRVRLLTGPNAGVSTARNRGLRYANGDYVVFFDADDYPEIDLIESFVKAQEAWLDEKLAWIMCGMAVDNRVNARVADKKQLLEEIYGFNEGEDYILERSYAATLAWLRLFNFVTNKFYNLDIIRENEIKFDEQINIGEDLKFNLDYLAVADGRLGMINRHLYHYVKRSRTSLSISYYESGLEDTKCLYKRFIYWEESQPESTEDDILVLKSIFITDWTARLTALYQEKRRTPEYESAKRRLERELRDREFQKMLTEVHEARKISTLRYIALKTRVFRVFYTMRSVLQILKG